MYDGSLFQTILREHPSRRSNIGIPHTRLYEFKKVLSYFLFVTWDSNLYVS